MDQDYKSLSSKNVDLSKQLDDLKDEVAVIGQDDADVEEACDNLLTKTADMAKSGGVFEKLLKDEIDKAVSELSMKVSAAVVKTSKELKSIASYARDVASSASGQRIVPDLELPPSSDDDSDSKNKGKKKTTKNNKANGGQ